MAKGGGRAFRPHPGSTMPILGAAPARGRALEEIRPLLRQPQDVEEAYEVLLGEAPVGDLLQDLLGVEGDPQAGVLDHEAVVRAVADGDDAVGADPLQPGEVVDYPPLGGGVDDLPIDLAGEEAVPDLQDVCEG